MKAEKLLVEISRQFFKDKKLYRFKTKKISELSDEDVITYCHIFCEDNNLTDEFYEFRKNIEKQFQYCPYLKEYIEQGFCYDMQIMAEKFIKNSVLTINLSESDLTKLQKCCSLCQYSL